MRRGALLNDAQLSGMLPTSVAGGENADGNWSLMAGFCGPGSVMLLGFLALIAPCGGSFGLPKEIGCFTGVALSALALCAPTVSAATPPAPSAAPSRSRRLEIVSRALSLVIACQRPPRRRGVDRSGHRIMCARRPTIALSVLL